MNCQECCELLDEYIEEALEPAARRETESHLGGCEMSFALQSGASWIGSRPLADAGVKGGALWTISGKN